jgi:hypothetical protein
MAAATEAPLSPATIWGPKIGNIVEEQKKYILSNKARLCTYNFCKGSWT